MLDTAAKQDGRFLKKPFVTSYRTAPIWEKSNIKNIIKRMDMRWDNGLILDEGEYMERRIKLQLELEQLKPVDDDELEQAADLLNNFKYHWERLEGNHEVRHELVKLIVERIYVANKEVKAMTLRSNYHLVLGHKTNEPTYQEVDPFLYQSGSDGIRCLAGCKCEIWTSGTEQYHLLIHKLLASGSNQIIMP